MPAPLPSVLVVSAEPARHAPLQRVLLTGGLRMRAAMPDSRLAARCELDPPALILLDLNCLGEAGVELCRQLRARIARPILVLGTSADRELLLAALDAGAADHLALPVQPDELLLRIQVALHHGPTMPQRADSRLRCGPLEIDRQTAQVWRHGQAVQLTAKERDILALLLAHPGQILTQQQVLERVWGSAYAEATNLLHTHISNLRRKIEADPAQPLYLLTERGIGYRFVLPSTGVGQAAASGTNGRPPASFTRYHLRGPIRDFVGRAEEVQQLRASLLAASQPGGVAAISGVQGMGGIGKTELAYLVAHQLRDAFPDGQIVLDLRGTSTAPLSEAQALHAVIRAFDRAEKPPDDVDELRSLYCSVLHERHVLILADDARDAAQVRPLLPPSGCALLVTSRQRFTLPGMLAIDLEQLPEAEAAAFLCRICPRLTDAEAQAIARACGYLPLALRVSGGLLRNNPALPVAAYIARLADERQRLLQLRDPDDEQLDVAASLALSYALLDGPTQCVFRQLGALVADVATPMALAVVAVAADGDVEAALHQLLRRNLVMYDAIEDRWRLHDLVRDLAQRYLEAANELEMTSWRYARAAVQLVQELRTQFLAGGDSQLAALVRFDAERPHIEAARRWASAQAGTAEGDRLLLDDALATTDIGPLYYHIQHEIIPQLEAALAAAQNLDDRNGEARILTRLGIAYGGVGEIQRAITYYQQALGIARTIGDRYCEGVALNSLGISHLVLGKTSRAIVYYQQALGIARTIGDRRYEAMALNNLGEAYGAIGDAERALAALEQALNIAHELGERQGEGIVLSDLGQTYLALGDAERAIAICTQALAIIREVHDQRREAYVLSALGRAYARLGDQTCALSEFKQALALFDAIGDRRGAAECGWHFGLVLAGWGERARALPLLRAALAYEREIGHAKSDEHAALLARLEAAEERPADRLSAPAWQVVGANAEASLFPHPRRCGDTPSPKLGEGVGGEGLGQWMPDQRETDRNRGQECASGREGDGDFRDFVLGD
jgi:DNA-binding response OmpR family regulator/tetratricopeptide (TPR) repeat protein